MDEQQKRGRGRPVTTGVTPNRNIRIGSIWDVAREIARERGENVADIARPAVERALRRYISQHSNEVWQRPHSGREPKDHA